MRVFVGLDIPEDTRTAIARYMDGLRNFAPEVRWVKPETFHVTLKFIGEQSAEQVERIQRELGMVKAPAMEIAFHDTGFFPNARSPRVFWVGIHAGPELRQLAASVDEAVARTGVAREKNEYSPHLTLSRSGSGSPRPKAGDRPSNQLARLAEKLKSMPQADFGRMTAREFYLYESKLGPGGAKYTKIGSFLLG